MSSFQKNKIRERSSGEKKKNMNITAQRKRRRKTSSPNSHCAQIVDTTLSHQPIRMKKTKSKEYRYAWKLFMFFFSSSIAQSLFPPFYLNSASILNAIVVAVFRDHYSFLCFFLFRLNFIYFQFKSRYVCIESN